MKEPVYDFEEMLKIDRECCDILTKASVYDPDPVFLTQYGMAVRRIWQALEHLQDYATAHPGCEATHVILEMALDSFLKLKRPLVVYSQVGTDG